MKEIKVTDLTKGGNMFDVAENWDILPIPRKIEIAKKAGIAGRVGASAWADLHEIDREAILKLYASEEPPLPTDKQITSYERQVREDKGELELAQDYLLWVGWGSYPTIKGFAAEADRIGVSRRISKIPKDLVLGQSKIFLAHDEGETGDAVIFGYFIPAGIEIIVFDDTTINGLGLRKDITPVTLEQVSAEGKRGGESRSDVGSIYLVSPSRLLTMLKPTKDYNHLIDEHGVRFRGIKKVDGQKILSGKAKKEPSLRYKIPKDQKMPRKKGDKWSPEEIALLTKLTSEMRPRRAFREMMKITGRSLPTMEWHYRKIRESEK